MLVVESKCAALSLDGKGDKGGCCGPVVSTPGAFCGECERYPCVHVGFLTALWFADLARKQDWRDKDRVYDASQASSDELVTEPQWFRPISLL